MSTYEWDETEPQPKPPTRKVRLSVAHVGPNGGLMWPGVRDATQADIARALGLTEQQLEAVLEYARTGSSRWFEQMRENEIYRSSAEAQQRAAEAQQRAYITQGQY